MFPSQRAPPAPGSNGPTPRNATGCFNPNKGVTSSRDVGSWGVLLSRHACLELRLEKLLSRAQLSRSQEFQRIFQQLFIIAAVAAGQSQRLIRCGGVFRWYYLGSTCAVPIGSRLPGGLP